MEKEYDIGKVASGGDIILTSKEATENKTYIAPENTAWDEVKVDVKPKLTTLGVVSNGNYTPPANYDGFSQVNVSVKQLTPEQVENVNKIPTIENNVNTNAQSITTLENKDTQIESKITTLENKDTQIESKITTLESKDTQIDKEINTLKDKIAKIEGRVLRLGITFNQAKTWLESGLKLPDLEIPTEVWTTLDYVKVEITDQLVNTNLGFGTLLPSYKVLEFGYSCLFGDTTTLVKIVADNTSFDTPTLKGFTCSATTNA